MKYPEAHNFAGLKLCTDEGYTAGISSIKLVKIARNGFKRIDQPVKEPVGTIGSGGNSGFQAINLAAQFGANPILLVGIDLCGSHFHPDHKPPLRNPSPETLERWREKLDAAAPIYESWGVEILNTSKRSALTAYPVVDLAKYLNTLR